MNKIYLTISTTTTNILVYLVLVDKKAGKAELSPSIDSVRNHLTEAFPDNKKVLLVLHRRLSHPIHKPLLRRHSALFDFLVLVPLSIVYDMTFSDTSTVNVK